MGKFCQLCEKGQMIGHNVSHSNRKSSRAWAPNVHKVRLMVDGRMVRVSLCTRCLRTLRGSNALVQAPDSAPETAEAAGAEE